MPTKLIYLITTLNQGGTERNLIQYCQSLDKKKYELSVWYLCETENSLRSKLEDTGIKLRCLGAAGGFNFRDLFAVAKSLTNSNADLIHIFLPTVAYYGVASRIIYRSKIPLVFSSGGVQLVLPFQAQMMKYGVGRYCNPIICNSQFVRNFWLEKGLNPNRLRVISNGHDLGKYEITESRDELRQHYGFESDQTIIMSVGRLIPSKRFRDLLKAFAALIKSSSEKLALRIAGDGPEKTRLCELSKELELNPDEIFLGQRKDIVELMKAADIFAFPSESEGSPNAVIEATFSNLPVVASDIDPCKEVIDHEKSGLLYSAGDHEQLAKNIEQMIANRSNAKQMAAVAYKDSKSRFELSATMIKLEEAYRDATA